jgi:ATP-dependent protease HslVU (ClpYQ) peptidase subunit
MRLSTIISAALLILAACTPNRGLADKMIPDVPNTNIVEGQTITDFVGKQADGQTLLAANPQLAAAIRFTENVVKCYQAIGGVALRMYSDRSFPVSAGMVVVVDKTAVTDVANLAFCLNQSRQVLVVPNTRQPVIQPCSANYDLTKKDEANKDHDLFIAYLASTPDMCHAFCSRLEGCTAH